MNQTITDIENAFPRVLAFLNALVAAGVVKTQSGVEITTILNDVNAAVQGAQQPSADLVGKVDQLLQDLQSEGVLQGTAIANIAKGLGQFQSFVKDVQNNQVAVIQTAALFGVSGIYAFIPAQSEQGKSLGLS